MMDVYINAMKASKGFNSTQYVIAKSLDIIYVPYGKTLLSFLKDGYDIMTKFNNGISEDSWRVDNPLVIRTMMEMANLHQNCDLLYIHTQTFYKNNNTETIYMYLDVWENNSPTTVYVTPKSFHDPDYERGQETALRMTQTLRKLNIKQDKDFVIDLLERETC